MCDKILKYNFILKYLIREYKLQNSNQEGDTLDFVQVV